MLEVESLIVAVDECFLEGSLRIVKLLGLLREASFLTFCACSLIDLMYLPILLLVQLVNNDYALSITCLFTELPGKCGLASATCRFAPPHLVGLLAANHKRLWITKKARTDSCSFAMFAVSM